MAYWQICGSTAPIVIKQPPAIEMFFKVCSICLKSLPPADYEPFQRHPWDHGISMNQALLVLGNLAATWLKVQKTQVESQPSMQYACQLFAKHWKTATCLPGFLVVFRWMCICLPDSNGGVINEDNHLMSLLRT
jgi:hypothetical protein